MKLLNQFFNPINYLLRSVLPLIVMLLSLTLGIAPVNATGVYQMPQVSASDRNWVIDQAEVISRINEGKIGSALEDLANETGNEVRLVTVRRLDYGETIDSFTQKLFTKWFPTPEAQANQTLLAIDTLTNNTAIRTGDKVKTLLSDDTAQSVVTETVPAPLREGEKYNQAFLDASDRLVAILSGKEDPGPPQIAQSVSVEGTFKAKDETDTNNATIWVIGLLLAATVIPMATYYLYVR
ncbi:photosystem II repair protein Psb32 [Gloeocapsopsis dulcis]|uniref:Beta-propeller domain-containing protein, methanol dehydrogenase n=1 Tax=Gloeocapsopsis dulcis AAB1 = 1H9 TaxID=1433147 RepID=A0A6N8FSP4_9CHRO|nr:TPM domain-containing protein [Gloeocapsopsis dulcis]MUL36128.1 beta-propeller domain-containing protein, methanol dehydrogenase [Gloeocapsopsis dulcis AAB1 = 1H9]WNN91398.1 TPM domain-containing protein [Gloeocapsopsis dulcis]